MATRALLVLALTLVGCESNRVTLDNVREYPTSRTSLDYVGTVEPYSNRIRRDMTRDRIKAYVKDRDEDFIDDLY